MKTTGAVSHSDWGHMAVVDPTRFAMDFHEFWGSTGIEYIVDRAKDSGLTRLYWRIFAGATTYHQTRVDDDNDSAPDFMIRTDFYRFPIEVERERSCFMLVDYTDTYHEIR